MDSTHLESGSGSFTDASPSLTPSLTPIPASLSTTTTTTATAGAAGAGAGAGTAASSTFRAASVTGPAIYYLGE